MGSKYIIADQVSLLICILCFSSLYREFAHTIPRPFSVRYNPYTQSVDIIKDKSSVQNLVSDIKYEVDILQDALRKLQWLKLSLKTFRL